MINKLLEPVFIKQLMKFLLVGGLATCIDALIYHFFSESLIAKGNYTEQEAVSLAKKVGSAIAVIWVFFANKFFTFGVKEGTGSQTYKFVILYTMTFLVNVSVHDLIYHFTATKSVSFVIATGITASINFICLKLWVFKEAQEVLEA